MAPMRSLAFFVAILFITCRLIAGTTGKIVGYVSDEETGEPLIGVNIVLENTTLGAATDLDGNYYIIGIPPGRYTILASYVSYSDVRISNIQVNIDKTTTINISMRPATLELEQAIEVVAERPLVKHDLTSTESTIDREIIDVLPVEDLNEVINLQAGVIDGHFRGGRSGEVQYMVNGVSINDVYSGSNAIEVENNAVQEVSVISGTFNAEYGQAMSGVVNIVTRDGGDKYAGTLTGYFGDYVSDTDDIFWGISDFNSNSNLQGTFGGPLPFTNNKVKFFASARYYDYAGYINAKKVFLPTDRTTDFLQKDDPQERQFEASGKTYTFSEQLAQHLIDNAESVSMNSSKRLSTNVKFSYRSGANDKLSLEGMYQWRNWRQYDHRFRLNPDGNYKYKQQSITTTLSWNHVFSTSTFLNTSLSYFHTGFGQNVYEDVNDPRYVVKERLQDTGANAFLSGGQQMWHFDRSTMTHLFKSEVTSQVNFNHQIKAGIEGRRHRLWMHEFEVIPEATPRIAPLSSFQNNRYLHYPVEISAYIQDKMEYEDLVINAGLRFDYFDPDGKVPVDFKQPSRSALRKAGTSRQFSPRLGLAYPISAGGVIHASYGHFFQTPNFFFLYTNPEFNIDPLQTTISPPPQSVKNIIGNAELKPQKTTIYEIGLSQQLGDLYALSVTAFFKDIRNLLGTEVLRTLEGITYGRYINRDYGYVRGLTIEFERRYHDNVAAAVDYTYQIARGNASDPNNAFLDAQSDKETEKQLVPLDWDRLHQINVSITVGRKENLAVSIIGRYGTGFPYTPSSRLVQPLVENGGRKPDVMTVDIYSTKNVRFMGLDYSLFLRIFNVLDRLNEQQVFTDTGRAGYSTEPLYFGGERPRGLNTLDQYYIRPDFYSEPRQIQIGFEVKF